MKSFDMKYEGAHITWAAFLAGACIGAGVALLVAPQAGSELRTRLRRYVFKTRDEVIERGREAWDSLAKGGAQYGRTGKEAPKEAEREGEHMEIGPEPRRSHAVRS
jgi:gas vesicle protein